MPVEKPWTALGQKQRKRLVEEVSATIQSKSDNALAASQFISQVLIDLKKVYPDLHVSLPDTEHSSSIPMSFLKDLGALRASVGKTFENDKPLFSIVQLDATVKTLGLSRSILVDNGYPISIRSFQNSGSQPISSERKKRGRPSKVHDSKFQELIHKSLQPYLLESEQVTVIGRGSKRQMVVAQHLKKKKYRIYLEEEELHSNMSWGTFHHILRVHFPYVRNPRRKTDVCEHCKHLEKKLFPRALQAMDKARADLVAAWPQYFNTFDSNAIIQAKKKDKDQFPLLSRFVAFVNTSNFHANSNQERVQALSLSAKLSLHALEAKTIHTMKAHVDIVEAYRWHQISARRQAKSLEALEAGGLKSNEALIQVDFKENVRYPLSISLLSFHRYIRLPLFLKILFHEPNCYQTF